MWGFGSFHMHRRGSPQAQNEDAPFGCFLMIAVPVLFAISTYFAWEELWYTLRGRTTTAKIERVIEPSELYTRRFRKKLYFEVVYTFLDEVTDESRTERDAVPRTWNRPQDMVNVVYIPGRADRSRLAGNRSYVSVLFFLVCTIAAVVYGVMTFCEARQAVCESEQHHVRRHRDR